MNFGLKPTELEFVLRHLVAPIEAAGGKVWVFGSRARGDQHPFSDLDLLIESPQPLPRGLLNSIREVFEESRLPFKVDIVLEEDLADSYRPTVFRDRIQISSIRRPHSN